MAAEPNTDVDFWEFVSCAKCHLPYASEPGKSVPFWLTECGHVVCNHHLNPDQSCASCGSTEILLVPLQQELDAPMSDWFKSIPMALDLVAFAAKFQQEVMARQIRFYRARHQQIRAVIEKLRSENSELKRTNEELAQENNQLKQQFGYQDSFSEGGQESSYTFNQNGKRPMGVPVYQHEYPSNRPRTGSSPHHGSTTPTRLTLPVNPRTSKLTHQNEGQAHPPVPQPLHGTTQNNTRPMSRQIGKFAYIPPDTSHTPSTSLSHAQMAPKLIRPSQLNRAGRNDSVTTNAQPQVVQQRTQASQHTAAQQGQPRNMGPPPVPQARLGTPAVTAGIPRQSNTLSRRFVPLQHSQRPQPSTSHGSQRFFPGASQSSSVASGSWSKSTTSDSAGRSAGASYG